MSRTVARKLCAAVVHDIEQRHDSRGRNKRDLRYCQLRTVLAPTAARHVPNGAPIAAIDRGAELLLGDRA